MPGLAVLSELPPARSGAAGAGGSLVGILCRAGYRPVKADWPLTEAVEARLASSDLGVFHVSNDLEDREIYELAVTEPGLVVLHDVALDRLVAGLVRTEDPIGGDAGREVQAASERVGELFPEGPLAVPWCAQLARRARGIVVHSTFAARYLEAMGCRTPVFVAPHPWAGEPSAVRRARGRARRIRRRLGPRPVVGVTGELGPDLRLETVLEATMRVDAHAVVIGPRVPGHEVGAAVREVGPGWATVVADPAPGDVAAWIGACDVVTDLGYPARAKVSGFLVRALQGGIPIVVGPTGRHLDWPEEAMVHVPEPQPDAAAVARAIRPLLRDGDVRRALGARGRAVADRMAAEAVPAYRRAVDGTIALLGDPVRRSLARWAASLRDVGAGEDDLARGYGMPYARALAELAAAQGPPRP